MPWLPRKPHPESLAIGALITAMIALGQISISVYVPSMPSMVEAFDTTAERVTLTFTVFLAGFAISQLIFGPLSDRYGRRPVLLMGFVVYFVGSLACVFAGSIEALIAGRLLQSVGACSGAVLGRAIVRDVYGPARAAKALAYIGIAFSLSPAISPIIGGYLQVWFGWRSVFAFLTGVSVILVVLAWSLLEETNRDPDPHALHLGGMARNFATIMRNPVFIGHMVAMSLVFAGLMSFVALAPFLIIDTLGLKPHHFGLVAALSSIGTLGGNLSAGYFTLKVGIERMVLIGILLALAGSGLMAISGLAGYFNVVLLSLSINIFLWGMGIVFPNAMAGALAPFGRMAGTASALMGFVQMAAGAGAAQLAGFLPHHSQWPLGLMMAGMTAVALIVFLVLVRPHTSH
ncbi:MAG: multidrug effflux MFS transporter [Alphaproteobacteria bacterium]|nr:multidrug effflux MFS transporter [Alphaproteobacteria bacterium]